MLNRAETAWGGTLPHNEDQGFSPNGEVVGVSTVVKPDTLYHVVFVYHGDTQADSFEGGVTGYLNGEPFGTTLGANILRNHTDGIGIGRRNSEVSFHDFIVNNAQSPEVFHSPQQFYFDGWIDEFALYNHALTEARVKAHYEAGMTEVPADPGTGGPTSIMLALSADGMVTIEFSGGSLHSSETVDGGFEPVAGATSPYSTSPAGTARFYLVK